MRMRDLAARGDEKPLRVESSSSGRFRAWANRSYPEGKRLLLCISTVRATLAVPQQKAGSAKRKTPKGGQRERAQREGHDGSAGRVKNFRAPAMLKTTPLDCERKATRESRGETRGVGRTRRQKRRLTRSQWLRRERESQACLDLVRRPVAQPPAEAS
jgi:hypothetical protein